MGLSLDLPWGDWFLAMCDSGLTARLTTVPQAVFSSTLGSFLCIPYIERTLLFPIAPFSLGPLRCLPTTAS